MLNLTCLSDNKLQLLLVSDVFFILWGSDCCLMPTQQFSAISWQEQVNFQWDDDEDCFNLVLVASPLSTQH
jgi:hypothetical protein